MRRYFIRRRSYAGDTFIVTNETITRYDWASGPEARTIYIDNPAGDSDRAALANTARWLEVTKSIFDPGSHFFDTYRGARENYDVPEIRACVVTHPPPPPPPPKPPPTNHKIGVPKNKLP